MANYGFASATLTQLQALEVNLMESVEKILVF